jgi:hypothetical protein
LTAPSAVVIQNDVSNQYSPIKALDTAVDEYFAALKRPLQ